MERNERRNPINTSGQFLLESGDTVFVMKDDKVVEVIETGEKSYNKVLRQYDEVASILENNIISEALNNVLVRNVSDVQIKNNYIHNASKNSIQVQDINNILIFNNTVCFNGRSGIETSNMVNSIKFIRINFIPSTLLIHYFTKNTI